jgi:tRNA(adenine34) deaminase
MKAALIQARIAFEKQEIPVGAVMVMDGQIIARAYNSTELLKDPTAHAEILAITAATNYLANKYLRDATLYVTLEPCLMCTGALFWSQIGTVVYGASDIKHVKHKIREYLHPKTQLVSHILAQESLALLQDFFRQKR